MDAVVGYERIGNFVALDPAEDGRTAKRLANQHVQVPLQFVVREYGLVLTTPKDGNTSVTLRAFLKDMEKNEVDAVPQSKLPQPTQVTPVPPMKK